jgi:hypothetical protein
MSTLTIKHKVDLFNKLYKEISGYGRGGDTELAHVNKYEAAVLKAMGGSGTVNPTTGLREYGWFDKDDDSPPPPTPTTTTVKQISDLPEYFRPYVEELFSTAQDVYERPYVPYGSEAVQDAEGKWSVQALPGEDAGKRLADVTAEQKAAFSGLQDLFTTVDPETGVRSFRDPTSAGHTEAARLRGRGARGFDELGQVDPETGEVIKTAGEVFQETYMSPYKQAVTDIQTREAQKLQEQQRQKRQGAARMANALGGGRYGVETALAGGIDAQLLDDIRKKGLQEAYTQGLSTFEADRLAAARGAEQELTGTSKAFADQLKGLGALQTTGETQRAIAQQPLDIGYEEFSRQQQFPKQNLQELSGILRGFNVPPTTYKTSQVYKQPPSLGSQLLAAGTLGAGISSGLGKSLFGKQPAAAGGLMSIAPEKYQEGGILDSIRDRTVIEDYLPSILNLLSGDREAREDRITERKRIAEEKGLPERGGPHWNKRFADAQHAQHLEEQEMTDIEDMLAYEKEFGPEIKSFAIDEEDTIGPDEFDITTLDTTAVEPSPEEGEVTETTTDETIFDFGAALPWFKMAAEFGKAGQDTSEAAAAALEEFESTTSKRKLSSAQIELYKAQAAYNAARPDIEAIKAGRARSKEQKDRVVKILSEKLTALLAMAGQSVGGSKAYEKVIQKTIRDLETVESSIVSTALPKRSVATE